MGVGRGDMGAKVTLDFEFFGKKGCFPWFRVGKNNISPLAAHPLETFRKNPLVAPPGKNPSDAHAVRVTFPC